jgi:acyl dehydratase
MFVEVGQRATRSLAVTREMVEAYARITGDRNPLHFDEAFAAGTRFGRLIAQGGIATGLLHALVAMDLPGPGSVFLRQQWSFPRPVYIGETITAEATVTSANERRAIAELEVFVRNEAGEPVLDGVATVWQASAGRSS